MRRVISAALFPLNDGFILISVVRDGNSARLKTELELCLHFALAPKGAGVCFGCVANLTICLYTVDITWRDGGIMYNDLFTIGRLTIHGYGLMIGIGVVCAVLVAQFRAKKKGLSTDSLYSIVLLALIFGFLGAKVLFCIVELKAILANPVLILSGDGFVLYGGILGGIAAVMLYCRAKKLSFLRYFDLAAPSIALAQGFGRIGCFLAGCCYGRQTDSPFCIVFHNSQYAPNGVKLIPTQLISSAGDFLIALVLLLYARRDRKRGKTGGLYLILYSVGRSAVEILRADYRGAVGPLSTSQFISIFTLALGILLFATDLFRKGKKAPAADADGTEDVGDGGAVDEPESDESIGAEAQAGTPDAEQPADTDGADDMKP